MNYLELLERSYQYEKAEGASTPDSRLEYLGDLIFEFTTYDSSMSRLFATKALEVCRAITEQTTFEYIANEEQYRWYLLMCNMPFFVPILEWGSSVRGAWWVPTIILDSCGLYNEKGDQIRTLTFSRVDWECFVRCMLLFAVPEAPELAPKGLVLETAKFVYLGRHPDKSVIPTKGGMNVTVALPPGVDNLKGAELRKACQVPSGDQLFQCVSRNRRSPISDNDEIEVKADGSSMFYSVSVQTGG
jgi:hypothetical protein